MPQSVSRPRSAPQGCRRTSVAGRSRRPWSRSRRPGAGRPRAARSLHPRPRRRRGRRRSCRLARARGRSPHRRRARTPGCSVRRTSLAPAGFLISRIETGLPSTSIVSTRPNTAFGPLQPADGFFEAHAQAQGGGEGTECVVDVVEAGEGETHGRRSLPGCGPRRSSRASRRARSSSPRRRGRGDRSRNSGTCSGPGARRTRARMSRARRTGDSAWRRGRAAAPAAPPSRPRSRST